MITAIILAAGMSTRMSKVKQTLILGSKPILQHVIDNVKNSMVDNIILVLGYKYNEILEKLDVSEINVNINSSYENGLSSSLKVGIKNISKNCTTFLIFLGDQPLFNDNLINQLISSHTKHKSKITIPIYDNMQKNPIVFDFSILNELLNINGDKGAKQILTKHEILKVKINIPEAFLDVDIDSDIVNISRFIK